MGRKVLLAVFCWLAISEAQESKTVNVSVTDSQSAESAPRLYQNVPVGVYASGVPYGSYSYHVPIVQHTAASQLSPKTETVLHNLNSLKDSYGKFVQVPHAAYKTFPQQYIQLQELPAHLSQPLVAVAPGFQYKQTAPHYFFGSQQYRVPSLQAATPTPITKYSGFSQPLVYAENIRNFAPSSGFYTQVHKFPTSQQQSSSNKDVYTNTPTFQRVQGISQGQVLSEKNKENENKQQAENENKQIQAAPAQTSVTAIVNGKKTVLTLETKPPLPLLNLDLLEPLTFANPLVPQVQHFLPRINQATYYTLPSFNANEEKKYQKDIVVQKTKSYDNGPIKGKPQIIAPKKKTQSKSRPQSDPSKPKITVKGSPDGEEFSYEINSPNLKETYNEQVVSYNKETNKKPVEYTYNKQTTKDPVHYSFVHSSKEPLHIKHVEYESDPQNPKQLIYKFSPEQEGQNHEVHRPQAESEESGESDESEEDSSASHEHHGDHEGPRHPQHSHQLQETPRYSHHGDSGHHETPRHAYNPEHNHPHKESPRNSQQHHEHQSHHGNSPSHSHDHIGHQSSSPRHPQSHNEYGHHGEPPRYSPSHNEHRGHHIESPRQQEEPPKQTHHNVGHHQLPTQSHHSGHSGQQSPRQIHHLKPEHREEYRNVPNYESHHPIVYGTPNNYHSQPLTVTVQNAFQPITPEYEEHITILPTHKPHNAAIKVNPNQHVQQGPSTPYQNGQPSPATQKFVPQQYHNHHHSPHSSPSPQIHEKSKHIIIEEKEESPDEMHTHTEQLMAQMIEQDDNNEEDFEKAYKESAFGFPAYEQTADYEKDIFDPSTYGASRYTEFKVDQSPFRQYEEEGDEFPKSARLTYRDESDKEKEKYFLDYSVSKPESLVDRYKKKEDYYKTFKKYKPEKLFVHEHDNKKKEKQKEKYITAPSHPFVYPAPAAKPKQQQYFARYKVVPKRYEYDYSKGAPSDSNAFASRHYQKHKTFFVEPQYQYGFEPISSPLVLDSELAVMASNDSPESEKPGSRKKIYKENWYIKKTSSTAGKTS